MPEQDRKPAAVKRDAAADGGGKPATVDRASAVDDGGGDDDFDCVSDDAIAKLFDSMEKDQAADADAEAEMYRILAAESNKLPTTYGGTVELLDDSSVDSDMSSDDLFPPSPFAKAAAASKATVALS